MVDIVRSVKCNITVHFSDGSTVDLPCVAEYDPQIQDYEQLDNYCTSVKLREQMYSKNNNNIIGNICGNSLDIEVNSKDGELISSNTSSQYYGLMNNTAYVTITAVTDSSETVNFGLYYVKAWENGQSASNYSKVSINCVNVLGLVKNIKLDKYPMSRKLSVKNYIKDAIDALNSKLESLYQIHYNLSDIDIFGDSTSDWQIWFNNIDIEDIEKILNGIAQDTLTNIWVDRNNYLKTDWLLNEPSSTPVTYTSGSVNVFDYGTDLAIDDSASGVQVEYISDIGYENKEILSMEEVELIVGSNTFNDIALNTSNVVNINTIEVVCEKGYAYCVAFNNSKGSIDFELISEESTTATVKVWGQCIVENKDTIERYIDNNNKSSVINLSNKLLKSELIDTYIGGVVQFMSYANNRIYIEGYINPSVKLGDIVSVIGSKLGIDSYYKVIGIEINFGLSYRCKLTLIKTFEITEDVNSLLFAHNVVLIKRLRGEDTSPSDIVTLSASDESKAVTLLGTDLTDLQDVVYGGA